MNWRVPIIFIAALSVLAPMGSLSDYSVFSSVLAQVPDLGNVTVPEVPRYGEQVYIVAAPESSLLNVRENSLASWNIVVRDATLEPLVFFPAVQVLCSVQRNTTISQSWAVQVPTPVSIGRGDVRVVPVQLNVGMMPKPDVFKVDVVCRAGGIMNNQVIGEFSLAARIDDFDYMALRQVDPPPVLRPDERFSYRMEVVNLGNRDRVFRGMVEAPEGWIVTYPDHVLVPAGESETVLISGITPRDKMLYRYESSFLSATYWPATAPEKAQTRQVPMQVNGLYMHPALLPLILLSVLALVLLIVLVVFARRTLEEQVLGKPMPPWRIPAERAYLAQLESTDPDEFYIVRYYLMVEEHESALLWYRSYKTATRKDRKREAKWIKLSGRVDRTAAKLERRIARRERRLRKMVARPARWHLRRRSRIEGKPLRKAWREQRRLLKIHAAGVTRMGAIHKKREAAAQALYKKERRNTLRKLEQENKKRAKRGEEPRPVPPESKPVLGEPWFPDLVEAPIPLLEESAYALRTAALERRRDRRQRAADRRASRRRAKVERLRARLERVRNERPQEPESLLYATDEYVPADDAAVIEERSFFARLLNRPSLEEAEDLRRRRLVVRARQKEARARQDTEEVQRIRQEWREERSRRVALRKAGAQPSPNRDAPNSRTTRKRRAKRVEAGTEAIAAAESGRGAASGTQEEATLPREKQPKAGRPTEER